MNKSLIILLVMLISISAYSQKLNREYVSGNEIDQAAGQPGSDPGNGLIDPGASLPSTGLMVALMSLGACAIVGIKQRKVA